MSNALTAFDDIEGGDRGRGDKAGKVSVLVVEDTQSLALVYGEYLRKRNYAVVTVGTAAGALQELERTSHPIVLLDLNLPDMNGMTVLKWISEQGLPIAVVVITAHGSVNVAVEAMRCGAYDFVIKPFTAERLAVTVRNALERLHLTQIVDRFKDDLGRHRYHGHIGSSLAMQAIYRIIDSAASSRATVFVTGESGTGKEVCAEAIHRQSPRRNGPFVAINCAAIPKDLMESEIFGHVKGAFTGAVVDHEGAASNANGGTLFLDEICEMDLGLQTKLLRFLQSGTIQKVGGTRTEKVDIRIICATNRDPLKEVEESRFREDLYYRLHVIPIHLPPLRERDDDVIEIASHFLTEYAAEERKGFVRFDGAVEQIFRAYPWPGNIRQLQNVIRNIVVLHDGELVTTAMLPAPLNQAVAPIGSGGSAAPSRVTLVADRQQIRPLWQVEKDAIEAALAACDGNIPRAASLLEISPSTIYRKKLAWEVEGRV
ncbi:MAG: sigma-54 dependent transcriptional regulator [Azospirillaceae bacterium]|nr:sigma-54 dependent transcriptional regulator [Azospirillaceae bacterium]